VKAIRSLLFWSETLDSALTTTTVILMNVFLYYKILFIFLVCLYDHNDMKCVMM
jgi:preprotein translocase subunit SecG